MNKRALAKKLDNLASNVAKRGVYVVTKKDDYYEVQNYMTKQVLVTEIPVRVLAERICNLYNKGKKQPMSQKLQMKSLSTAYFKLKTDLIVFKHTMKTTKDMDKYDVAEFRASEVASRLNHVTQQLEHL